MPASGFFKIPRMEKKLSTIVSGSVEGLYQSVRETNLPQATTTQTTISIEREAGPWGRMTQ